MLKLRFIHILLFCGALCGLPHLNSCAPDHNHSSRVLTSVAGGERTGSSVQRSSSQMIGSQVIERQAASACPYGNEMVIKITVDEPKLIKLLSGKIESFEINNKLLLNDSITLSADASRITVYLSQSDAGRELSENPVTIRMMIKTEDNRLHPVTVSSLDLLKFKKTAQDCSESFAHWHFYGKIPAGTVAL